MMEDARIKLGDLLSAAEVGMFWVQPKSKTTEIESFLSHDHHNYCDGPCDPAGFYRTCCAIPLYARSEDLFSTAEDLGAFLRQTSADCETLQVWEVEGEVRKDGLRGFSFALNSRFNRHPSAGAS